MRHILFLYPLLPVFAGLGFVRIPWRIQLGISVLLIIVSSYTYMQWGRYSYIYIPQIMHWKTTEQFPGDDRLICIPKAIDYLNQHAESGSTVYYTRKREFMLQHDRYGNSWAYKNVPKNTIHRTGRMSHAKLPDYSIVTSKNIPLSEDIVSLFDDSDIQTFWEDTLPTGERVCAVFSYGTRKSVNDVNAGTGDGR